MKFLFCSFLDTETKEKIREMVPYGEGLDEGCDSEYYGDGSPPWYCTRDEKHECLHAAYGGPRGYPYAIWGEDEDWPEELDDGMDR